jgi:hypothetical protein
MWGIDSAEDYAQWKQGLSPRKQREVVLLEQMILLADIDHLAEDDLAEAQRLLLTFSIGKR